MDEHLLRIGIVGSMDLIEEILTFWFVGDLSEIYRTKWFPTGNIDIQKKVDGDICSRFSVKLDEAFNGSLDIWKSYGPKGYVALIVVLDQFSRHIFRHKDFASDNFTRSQADSMALSVTQEFISIPGWSDFLSTPQYIFSLMPLRHSPTISRLSFLLGQIDSREKQEYSHLDLIGKFRKQTLRRLQDMQDKSKALASDDILERHPFDADETDLPLNRLVLSTEIFLRRYMGKFGEIESVAISLSGGVDSMVIAKILSSLRGKAPIGEIVAIHIDYANRAESGREADFVESYCARLGMRFEKRLINEVTRGITDRAEYERVARDIRYDFYRQILSATGCAGVIFGHHLGDVQENVISNVMRGSSPLWLSGMAEVGTSNGVSVWRPLLAHSKQEIYDFAHKYGVPYFKDTTPSWSTRGKLRNQLIPLLVDMYGAGCLRNLSGLAAESDATRGLVQRALYGPFLQSVLRLPCGLSVNVLPYRDQPLCFWKEMLKELMHSMGMSLVREKAVSSFMERLDKRVQSTNSKQRVKKIDRGGASGSTTAAAVAAKVAAITVDAVSTKGAGLGTAGVSVGIAYGPVVAGWLELRKGFHSLLTSDGSLVIFRDGVIAKLADEREAPGSCTSTVSPAVSPAVSAAAEATPAVAAGNANCGQAEGRWPVGWRYVLHPSLWLPTPSDELGAAVAGTVGGITSGGDLMTASNVSERHTVGASGRTMLSQTVLGSWRVTIWQLVKGMEDARVASLSAAPTEGEATELTEGGGPPPPPPAAAAVFTQGEGVRKAEKEPLLSVLRSPSDLLSGSFSYHLTIPRSSVGTDDAVGAAVAAVTTVDTRAAGGAMPVTASAAAGPVVTLEVLADVQAELKRLKASSSSAPPSRSAAAKKRSERQKCGSKDDASVSISASTTAAAVSATDLGAASVTVSALQESALLEVGEGVGVEAVAVVGDAMGSMTVTCNDGGLKNELAVGTAEEEVGGVLGHRERLVQPVAALTGGDQRLKASLPLLVPVVTQGPHSISTSTLSPPRCKVGDSMRESYESLLLQLEYVYIGGEC